MCRHDYKIVSEHEAQKWADEANEYVALIQCIKCGKAKYITNENTKFYIVYFSLLVTILITVAALGSHFLGS